MEKYLQVDAASLEEMLAACEDYRERQNIRCALRELKGLKLDGNDVNTYAFASDSVKHLASDTSLRKEQLPLKPSAINSDLNDKKHQATNADSKDPCKETKWHRERPRKLYDKTEENENQKPKYRSYLFAGTLSSPKHSPRDKKDLRSPRKVHTAITRIKVVDKSDLVDKCTETEDGRLDTQAEREISASAAQCQKTVRLKDRHETIKRYESTPVPTSQTEEKGSEVELDVSAIEFSTDLQKVKQTSVLHRPVSVNISSLSREHPKSTLSHTPSTLCSPRKPKKIVSYRKSAFSATSKLNPISSTVSRARLQSAPPSLNESSSQKHFKPEDNAVIEVADGSNTCDISDKQFIDTPSDTARRVTGFAKCDIETNEKLGENDKICAKNSTEIFVDNQENIFTAKPIEIKRESEESFVARIKSKLESTRRDFKRDLQEFSYFTNKMKEKHDKTHNADEKFIILSPVVTEPCVQSEENKVNSRLNTISNDTNIKTMTMDENIQNDLPKKKSGLSRKSRIDSDEQKHFRNYHKKSKGIDSGVKNEVKSPGDQQRTVTQKTPRNIAKAGSVRRKLPEIPIKQDNRQEDDETVHQRTIRLLAERRNERRIKLLSEKKTEKEATENTEKSKMSPADLRKTLELKLERSDSKRKACRVRRELQLLNRENEHKSDAGNKTSVETEKTENEINEMTKSNSIISEKGNDRKVVQRSKSDIVRRRRAVSETDGLIAASEDRIDGKSIDESALKTLEIENLLTPMGKIELIGTLMQEEAKLQEMLRKSTNFNDKRRMRAEVRYLRQRRLAIESEGEQQPIPTLQRSASVTAGVITHATPVYITAPATPSEEHSNEAPSQPRIEELRKKLSEAQDYDEKKKIRLALRQLRQQTREGPQSTLKRSQSFIHQKSSVPVTNENYLNAQTVLRSRSVTEKCVHSNDELNNRDRTTLTVTNGDSAPSEDENIKCSNSSHIECGRNKLDQDSIIDTGTPQRPSENRKKKSSRTKSDNVDANLKNQPADEFKCEVKHKSSDNFKHPESVRHLKNDRNSYKAEQVPKNENKGSGILPYTKLISEVAKSPDSNRKSFDSLKENVVNHNQDSLKKKTILEKCEVFERASRSESNVERARSCKRDGEVISDRVKHKTPHILVSRADVERNKQNKLISVRKNRSNSAPPLQAGYSNNSTPERNKYRSNQHTDKSVNAEKKVNDEIKNRSLDIRSFPEENEDKSKHCETHKNSDTVNEIDDRVSPSLLWLAEKRKSLPLSNDVDKLMSTMDIEAAFSEILGAVEEFPDLNTAVETQTTDTPIEEEDSQEGVELEQDLKNNSAGEIHNGELQTETQRNEDMINDTKVNDTENEQVNSVTAVNGDSDSAVQEKPRNSKSEEKLQSHGKLSLDVSSQPENNGAISVLHGEDGTVTVQEVSRVQEGDTTITEWKKLRRTQSKTEMRETDTVIEKKITSPGGSSSVYEKDVSKTKHKLTSRGSNYFTRNTYNIKRKKDLDGTELVEHDLSSVSENTSVSKNESWADKSEAKLVMNRGSDGNVPLQLKSTEEKADIGEKLQEENSVLPPSEDSHCVGLSVLNEHLGRPTGCPEVKTVLREITVAEGDTAVLECVVVVSSPLPAVSWFREGDRLSEDDAGVAISFDSESGKASLTIPTVSSKAEGEYRCVFENSLGTASTKGRLLVKKTCADVPHFRTKLSDVTVFEGHSLCLECQVSDTDTVTWYKDGVIQRNTSDFKQTFDGSKAKLEIDEVYLDDCGAYSCMLINVNGEEKCSCTVTVTESECTDIVYPMFLKKPETTIANEGDPVIIDCEVIGSPQPVITWYCDGSKVTEDSRHRMSYDGRVAMLVARKVTVGESGKIECVGENSAGRVSADCHLIIKAQKAAPCVRESLADLTIASGQKARLRCIITGEPKPEISWRKNGLVIGQMFDFKQTYEDSVAMLEIGETCSKDGGCYECLAVNEKGQISSSCQLILTDEKVPAEESTPVKMTQAKVTVHKEPVQPASVKTSSCTIQLDSSQKQVAKSQASKVMLVRQGSLRALRQEKSEKPLVRSGSLQSVCVPSKVNDSNKCNNLVNSNNINNLKVDINKVSPSELSGPSKDIIDVNENYKTSVNAEVPEPVRARNGVQNEQNTTTSEEKPKTIKSGIELSSLCLEGSNVKEVKQVAKFRVGGEIRRSQSVKTIGSEKPEWLQVKLRKVGSNKPSPLAMESKQLETSKQNSTTGKNVVQNETPVSVQNDTKLSRSQSATAVDRSLALRDSTNSQSNQPKRDSLKLTPVSERAKMFQTKEPSSSGKSSPVDIISKAIHLSRTESLRSSGGNKSQNIKRSQSFRTETPTVGDVTLDLTPPKSQEGDKKSESSSGPKEIQYWDPSAPSLTKMDYSRMNDEEELSQLLSKSDNFDERKKIRARIKEVRDQHMKEWQAKSAARQTDHEDPIKRKHREADLLKQQKLKQFDKQAAEHHESKHLDRAEQQLRERVRIADEEKKKTLQDYADRGASHQESLHLEISERALKEKIKQADILKKKTLDAYDQAAGKTDGKTVTTTRKVETVTKVGGETGKPAEEIAPQLAQKILKAVPSVGGVLTVKTESWSSKDNVTRTSEKTETWGGRGGAGRGAGRGGAMNAFKAMDAKNAPKTNLAPGAGRANITRSPSAIKTMLLEWSKAMTREYTDIIEITNFSTSWNNGLAFCALIHHFYPDAFDITSLDPKERRKNFELAFDMAEKLADIAPLLDVEDMVRMQKPDWKCVFTYVQSFYRKLNSHERNKAMA